MENQTGNPNAVKWLLEFTRGRRKRYAASVLLAILGVGSTLAIYAVMAHIITTLVGNGRDWNWYLRQSLYMALLWTLRYLLHSFSTATSHKATFEVLREIRRKLLAKLARLPLGAIQENSSGAYKNTICERVDSIETTLAHIVPEFTANICGAIAFLSI